jgi:hypothetical protein
MKIVPILGLLFSIVAAACGQADKPLFCKQQVLAKLKPIPKFEYQCDPDRTDDSSEEILKMPARIDALRAYVKKLERLSDPDWWVAAVDDLNLCYFRGKAGALDDQEREKFGDGDWQLELFGNLRFRLILAPDPCYQTGFNGANAFLLSREAGIVHASCNLNHLPAAARRNSLPLVREKPRVLHVRLFAIPEFLEAYIAGSAKRKLNLAGSSNVGSGIN